MGLTYIQATVANPARPRGGVRLKLLVDSGALYSVVPALVLRRLGIRKGKTKSFILADGSEVRRSIGQALFRINGDEGASPVIFGEEGDSVLLGSVSLEALGLMLDPLKRELRPLPMMLASARTWPPAEAAFRHSPRPRRPPQNTSDPGQNATPERSGNFTSHKSPFSTIAARSRPKD